MHACCVGEDPLADDQTDQDINSVAGVLKLYFRGLENPLFPKERFLDFISTTSKSPSRESLSVFSLLAAPQDFGKNRISIRFAKIKNNADAVLIKSKQS